MHAPASTGAAARGLGERRAGWVRFDRVVAAITEFPAAVLVACEAVILLAGVISRYVFNAPLAWSDELASILFLWLAMLGAVIALRRDAHMRLTTFLGMMRPRRRAWVETLSIVVIVVFALMMLEPAWDHMIDQWVVTTPALEWPDGVRVAALGVGAVLLLVIALARLAERASWVDALSCIAAVALLAGGLWALKPVFAQLGNWNLLIFFVVLVAVFVVLGLPIAFAFGTATFAYLVFTTTTPLTIVVSRMDEGMSHIILLSVPLFVLLGALIEMTGLARAMVDFLAALIGHVRGGLQYVLLGAMYLVSGISGSKAADMAAVAPALFPEM
jgi:TRAP-type C4-dicarboxylate transport system permease small subunit